MHAIRQHRQIGLTVIVIVVGVVAVMLWRVEGFERWLGEGGEAATVEVVRVLDGDTLSVERRSVCASLELMLQRRPVPGDWGTGARMRRLR